jgi:EsV-1-7 cysteine-rich motif
VQFEWELDILPNYYRPGCPSSILFPDQIQKKIMRYNQINLYIFEQSAVLFTMSPLRKQTVTKKSAHSAKKESKKMKHNKQCGHDQCIKKPEYGIQGVGARMCRLHKLDGMTNLRRKLCLCGTRPSFGLPGESATCCATCKTSDMVDVVHESKCPCGVHPSFGLPGERPTCCSKCKTSDMVNVVNSKCSCGTQPSFGLPGERRTCCSKCKTPDMVNVVHETCPCDTHPSFGLPGERPTCCSKCKTPGMVDVVNLKCSCGTQPVFGLPGERPTCCATCKTPDMVNVKNSTCPCGTQPHFGLPGERSTCCSKCKTPDMVDVKHSTCPCGTHPSFGLPGESASCCATCKTPDMVDVKHSTCPCATRPSFGLPGERATCCAKCKTCDMVDVKTKMCEHGSRLRLCSGSAATCGKSLYGRSKEEVRMMAFVYMCCTDNDSLQDFLSSLLLKYTPQDSSWVNDCEERVRSVINVDMVLDTPLGNLYVEYDGQYYHQNKQSHDTATTTQLLGSGARVLRIRDRLPPLAVQSDHYQCVNVDARWSTEQVARKVHVELFNSTVEWSKLWQTARSLGERAIAHFIDPTQTVMTQFSSVTDSQ